VAYDVAEKILRIALQRFEFRIGFTDDVRLSLDASPQKRTQSSPPPWRGS